MAPALKPPETPQSFQQTSFLGKMTEGVWLVIANLLGSNPLFLRSSHVMTFL